eukprot:487771_1
MTVILLLLCAIRLTIGINVVEWSSHHAAACGDDCDAHALLNGDLSDKGMWNAGTGLSVQHWVIFDFGADVTLSRFDFMSMGDTTHDVKDFKLYSSDTSDKNGAWTELLSGTGTAGTAQWQQFPVNTAIKAQYYQWIIETKYSQYQGVIREVSFEYDEVQRDCSVLAIDEFLLQCSSAFPSTQQQVTDLDNRLTQNTNDITQLQNDLNNGNTVVTTEIQQLQTDVDNVNARIDLYAAKSVNGMIDSSHSNDLNNFNVSVKDVFIILLMAVNLVVMVYI